MATVKGGLIKKQAAVQTEAGNGVRSIKDLVVQMGPQIAKALPTVLTPERFTRMVLTAMSTNPQLQQCTRLAYKIAAPEVFTFSFNIAFKKGIKDTMLATIKGNSGYLVLGVDGDSNKMFLRGSDGMD